MLVVWQTIALALVAGWLLHRGLRSTRVGDEPRCRRCDYRLDGLTSQQCPECGTAISDKNVVHGMRVVRWRVLFLIFLIPLLASPVQRLIWIVPNIDWYRYYPADWLYGWAEADDRHSIEELGRRIDENQFTSDQVVRIFALTQKKLHKTPVDVKSRRFLESRVWRNAEQASSVQTPWIQLLQQILTNRKLSPALEDNIFPSHQKIDLVHRSTIRSGDPLVLQYRLTETRTGTISCGFEHKPNSIRINEQSLEPFKDFVSTPHGDYIPANYLVNASGYIAIDTRGWKPGSKKIEYWGGTQYLYSIRSGGEAIDAITSVHVLPQTAAPLVGWANSEVTGQEIRSVMHVYVSEIECCFGSLSLARIGVHLFEPLGVSVAWSVSLEINGCEYGEKASLTDSFSPSSRPYPVWAKGETGRWTSPTAVDAFGTTEVYVVLRGDQTLGMVHPDISEVWKGELRFGPIPWEARFLENPENFIWQSSP